MENSLAALRPDLVAEWADTTRSPETVTTGSEYKATWKCDKGHEYDMSVTARANRNSKCPICSGRRIVPGINDLATLHPSLATQWRDSREVFSVAPGSDYAARWECEHGHTWTMKVYRRTKAERPQGCPVCAGRKTVPGATDVGSLHPELAAEWDDPKDITTVGPGSHYTARWLCPQGHGWDAAVRARVQGGGCPTCSSLGARKPHLAEEWADHRDVYAVSEFSKYRASWRCAAGHTWTSQVDNRSRGSGCPECNAKRFVSRQESEVAEYIRSVYDGPVETTVRRFPGIVELDIYLPDLRLGIEFNGVYSHSEANRRGKTYHSDKVEACAAQGIRLIQVWQDDWTERPAVVKNMLAHKVGTSEQERIPARRANAEHVGKAEAKAFLECNHLQGFTGASYHLGLRSAGVLIAVLSLKRTGKPGELRLERYATSAVVAGGQSKLLRHAEKSVPDWETIITFADHEVSDGHLYEASGWVKDGVLRPDYKYLVGSRRVHKFNYRLARFRSDPSLEYVEGMTERELADLNGLYRVWDSGKTRYRYTRRT